MKLLLDETRHMTDQPLPNEVLARRQSLPLKPDPVTLTGRYVQLTPLLLERDVEALYAVSNGLAACLGDRSIEAYDSDERIWRYMFAGPFASQADFAVYLRGQVLASNGLCFCVSDLNTGQPVGVYNYLNNVPEHLKIELGSIWFSPLAQRTKANLESTYLALAHAFQLGYRRLEWKCNALNERSRKSALRMGFKFEGIQEAHLIVKNCNRDTAWFRMLDTEWQAVKIQLENLLYR